MDVVEYMELKGFDVHNEKELKVHENVHRSEYESILNAFRNSHMGCSLHDIAIASTYNEEEQDDM